MMQSHRDNASTTMETRPDHRVSAMAGPGTARPNSPHNWSEGRRRFLQQHQDRYLQRLTILREALIKEKDFVRLSLPTNCDKNTGFWEAIMADFEDPSPHHKFPNSKSARPHQASVGGSLSTEQNRRAHLERLRRIRIMQMRRKLPPQLEPIHGIGLGGKKEPKPRLLDNRQNFRVPPTTYHVDWMRGNHMITPMAMVDQEKAIASWTSKHLRTAEPLTVQEEKLPGDIRSLLRRSRHSGDASENSSRERQKKLAVRTVTPPMSEAPQTKRKVLQISTPRPDNDTSITRKSTARLLAENLSPPPPPVSSPSQHTPLMSEIISHHSSTSSREDSKSINERSLDEREEIGEYSSDMAHENGVNDPDEAHLVDRASSPVGFRLPPLERSARTSVSSSANSKRHIVVKIPHGDK